MTFGSVRFASNVMIDIARFPSVKRSKYGYIGSIWVVFGG